MKTAVLVLATLAVAYAAVVPTKSTKKVADSEFLKRQKNILGLLVGVGHEKTFTNEYEDFDIAGAIDHYTEPQVVRDFLEAYKHGFLPKDGVFTMDCKKTRNQVIKLFELFYFAKDFDTFYKTACWARKHLSGHQFAYAFYVAVYHRTDCHGFVLPPIYEVFPHSFIHSQVLQKFYDAKMEGLQEYKAYLNTTGWEYYWQSYLYDGIVANPWESYTKSTEERLSYFREDVGLNNLIAQFFVFYPTWLKQDRYPKIKYFRRGELYYYFFQQLFARYNLERYANAMPPTESLFWDKPIQNGYNPKLVNYLGRPYHVRPDNMVPYEFNPVGTERAWQYERRLAQSIDSGYMYSAYNKSYESISNFDGIDYLGNTIFGTPESYTRKYYGSYFWKALEAIAYMSRTGSDKDFTYGALGSIASAGRDPAFYMVIQRIVKLFQSTKKFVPYYTDAELGFPGVKVESFEFNKDNKLYTYFDRNEFEVTNAVPVHGEKSYKDYHYVAKQYTLNHKPFTYKLSISSDKATDAIVRVFIGPKYDSEGHEMTLDQARMAYVEYDRYSVKLTNGQNVFERSSKDSPAFVEDPEGFRSYYTHVKESIDKQEPFYVSESYHSCGFPNRFLLPRGWKDGIEFKMFVIVSPYEEKYTPQPEERHFDSYILCGDSRYYDHRAYGFPFDRKVSYTTEFTHPNMYFKDVVIYHKEEGDINRPHTE